jgi:hypothetical protein
MQPQDKCPAAAGILLVLGRGFAVDFLQNILSQSAVTHHDQVI